MKEILSTLSAEKNGHAAAQPAKEIRQMLLDCQVRAIKEQEDKIVSISKKLTKIDPLSILAQFNLSNQLNFYWENQYNKEAIAAIGAIEQLKVEDHHQDRFSLAQKQIQAWQNRMIHLGEMDSFVAQNHFFCGFTFSENNRSLDFSPFSNATLILPKLQFIKKDDQYWGIQNFLITPETDLDCLLETYEYHFSWSKLTTQAIAEFNHRTINQFKPHHLQQNLEHFRQSVVSVLESIEKKEFSKIVIAHVVDLMSVTPFPLIQALKNLRNQYPNCYIFAFGNGEGSHFLGASPERLLKINNQQLITDAIAGSAPRGNSPEVDFQLGQKLLNNEKERREHQAVVTFISQRLQQLGLPVKTAPTSLLKLSNIQHLWTPIYSPFLTHLHPLEIVAKLHPTPAVSGVPTSIACQEIQRYESFDRSLYAAPIGWIDERGNSQFVVGIRSALVMGHQARLYAGAGIVAGSNPDQEVAEIQLKLQAMLKTLL